MEALLTSTVLVAVAEIGDKTQLLSFVLAARLRKPLPIIAGILVATLANHALAGSLGAWLASLASPQTLKWTAAIAFVAFGIWTLKPDTLDEEPRTSSAGAFATALVAFFLAEMGDKTQFATIALAARFDDLLSVVAGTTIGMMLANVPAVAVGERLAEKIPMGAVRMFAAVLFVATGVWTALS